MLKSRNNYMIWRSLFRVLSNPKKLTKRVTKRRGAKHFKQ